MRKLSMTSGRDAKLRLHTDVDIQCHPRLFKGTNHNLTERQYDVGGTVACVLAAASTLHGTCLATFACTHAHSAAYIARARAHTHTHTHTHARTVAQKRLVQLTCTGHPERSDFDYLQHSYYSGHAHYKHYTGTAACLCM